MEELFDLVKEHEVESLSGDALATAWIRITLQYSKGRCECSPMLLQLRWYQLKKHARNRIYKKTAEEHLHQKLLIAIAIKYQKIITTPFKEWNTLLKSSLMIHPNEFVKVILKQEVEWKEVEASELWYLQRENRIPISNIKTNHDVAPIIIANVKGNVDMPTESYCEAKNLKHDITPKRMVDNILLANDKKSDEFVLCDSDDEFNEILREKADNLIELSQTKLEGGHESKISKIKNKSDVNKLLSKMTTGAPKLNNEPILLDSDDEIDIILQEKADLISKDGYIDVQDKKTKQQETSKRKNQYEGMEDVDFDSEYFEFLDDGIEFVEDVNKDQKKRKKSVYSTDTSENEDEPEIDLKLLMNATVLTKKLNHMEVFKFVDFDQVNDKRVIECAALESKPVDKLAPKIEDIDKFREQAIPTNEKYSTQNANGMIHTAKKINADNKIKCTSWLLQKPRDRRYNMTQVSNNPDFNTNLKSLAIEFFKSRRNLELIKKCIPLTVDLHKEFEKKLIDGRVYLERGEFKSARVSTVENKTNHIPKISVRNPTAILQEYVESVNVPTETIKHKYECEINGVVNVAMPSVTKKLKPNQCYVNYRRKVINLPHIDDVRLANQRLLTAEITPTHQILSNSDTTTNKGELVTSNARRDDRGTEKNILIHPTCINNSQKVDNSPVSIEDVATGRPFNFLPEGVNSVDVNAEKNSEQLQDRIKYLGSTNTLVLNETFPISATEEPSSSKQGLYKYSAKGYYTKRQELVNTAKRRRFIDSYEQTSQNQNSLIHSLEQNSSMISKSPNKSNQATPFLVLPNGVNFVRLPSKELAVSINPGIQVTREYLSVLMSVCASVNAADEKKQNDQTSWTDKSLLKISHLHALAIAPLEKNSKPIAKKAVKTNIEKKSKITEPSLEWVYEKPIFLTDKTDPHTSKRDEIVSEVSNIDSVTSENESVNPALNSFASEMRTNMGIESVNPESLLTVSNISKNMHTESVNPDLNSVASEITPKMGIESVNPESYSNVTLEIHTFASEEGKDCDADMSILGV